jgi:hypothetical protein
VSDQVPDGLRAGSLVAGYHLEERIGEGGMAAVFRAHDSRLGPSNLAVVSTAKALSGKPALLGHLPVGPVLRQFAVEPGGHVVLVTVQGAGRLEAVNVGGLP